MDGIDGRPDFIGAIDVGLRDESDWIAADYDGRRRLRRGGRAAREKSE
jgi:hypothetical protein